MGVNFPGEGHREVSGEVVKPVTEEGLSVHVPLPIGASS